MTSDAIFVHHGCGADRVDKATGTAVWTNPGTCSGGALHSPSILGGELYLVDNGVPGGVVLDPSTGAQVGGLFDSIATPAGSAGVGYYITYLARSVAAIPYGSTTALWSSGSQLFGSPLVVGSNVVVGSSSSGLYVFSTVDGSLVSSVPGQVNIGTASLPGIEEADGLLFVAMGTSLVAY
jgi:hypothetical protein